MTGPPPVDGVLLVAFGGPTPGCCRRRDPCPGEAWCFVDGVLGHAPGRSRHVDEVAGHYRELGGYSPFNELTLQQARALESALAARGLGLPVHAGFRHWSPSVQEVLAAMGARGHRRVLGVVLAPHQSTVSWDWYLRVVLEATAALGEAGPAVAGFVDPWWEAEGFVEAAADRVRESTASWEGARAADAALVFTAHAIPEPVARTSPYARQLAGTAERVARELGRRGWHLAYQSRSADSRIAWTGPDVGELLEGLAAEGVHDVVVAPVGFLVDHVEVLYDLDVAARHRAEALGLGWARTGTVGDHPRFIAMLADRVGAGIRRYA
ncbi:MAG: ferrochelatase [Planctomycetes bacterium]|nr:ferrochelatase [Planctomycetota bacterium]